MSELTPKQIGALIGGQILRSIHKSHQSPEQLGIVFDNCCEHCGVKASNMKAMITGDPSFIVFVEKNGLHLASAEEIKNGGEWWNGHWAGLCKEFLELVTSFTT